MEHIFQHFDVIKFDPAPQQDFSENCFEPLAMIAKVHLHRRQLPKEMRGKEESRVKSSIDKNKLQKFKESTDNT